jgi:hypothetical protein
MIIRSVIAMAVFAVAAAGCGEKPQTGATARKSDAKPWEGAASPYAAPNWKGGDETAWEAQMRVRAQGQNEYARIAATATAPAGAASKTQ